MATSTQDIQDKEIDDLKKAIENGLVSKNVLQENPLGSTPLKVVTGQQNTRSVSFDLKPGAIVAHAGATIIFVCG